jgi:molecular chaperone GrpE (heat shock protein)
MSDPTGTKLPKWPFFLGDCLLLGSAFFICSQNHAGLGHWELCLIVLCVLAGALLSITPFLLDYRVTLRLAEVAALTTVVSQIQKLEAVAGQISGATGKWQDAQEQAEKTALAAREIAERMTTEGKSFMEFMQRANDSEKATLRLEVEKLRRAEGDWLQVLVRLLDHVYALYSGALRSGQPMLIAQLGNFQNACRDAARRVGLTPFAAETDQPFDPQRHTIPDGNQPPPDATIAETIATGYSFQGKLIRPALVRVGSESAPPTAALSEPEQPRLPLVPEETP